MDKINEMDTLLDYAETLREDLDSIAARHDFEGNCFSVAATVILDIEPADGFHLELVHGSAIGRGAIEGLEYGHGWVELTGPGGETVVIDYSNGTSAIMPSAVYYAIGGIGETFVYTRANAVVELVRSRHYGPWEDYFKTVA